MIDPPIDETGHKGDDEIGPCPLCGGECVLAEAQAMMTCMNAGGPLATVLLHKRIECVGHDLDCEYYIEGLSEEALLKKHAAFSALGVEKRRMEDELSRCAAGPWMPARDAPKNTPGILIDPVNNSVMAITRETKARWRLSFSHTRTIRDATGMVFAEIRKPKE